MAIYTPGKRNRKKKVAGSKRSVVAVLSLTAMVDMFTVLVIFLLQHYAVTGEVIEIDDRLVLPDARTVKELKPSNAVVVNSQTLSLNNVDVLTYDQLRDTSDLMIPQLHLKVREVIARGARESQKLGAKLKEAMNKDESGDPLNSIPKYKKMTVQADREIDFRSIKKVMFTLTEAGVEEINFAVIKKNDEK